VETHSANSTHSTHFRQRLPSQYINKQFFKTLTKDHKMADVKALAESLVGLTVKEVQELAEVLKADYGIEPAAAAV